MCIYCRGFVWTKYKIYSGRTTDLCHSIMHKTIFKTNIDFNSNVYSKHTYIPAYLTLSPSLSLSLIYCHCWSHWPFVTLIQFLLFYEYMKTKWMKCRQSKKSQENVYRYKKKIERKNGFISISVSVITMVSPIEFLTTLMLYQ